MDICYKSSNNKYNELPPRMSDGRHFTDYRSNCLVNNLIISNNRNLSSREFKDFLMNNANSLRQINRTYINQKNGIPDTNYSSYQPPKYRVYCNNYNCRKVLENPKGFGTEIEHGINFNDNIEKPPFIPNKCSKYSNFRY